jgi:hypothetical protein
MMPTARTVAPATVIAMAIAMMRYARPECVTIILVTAVVTTNVVPAGRATTPTVVAPATTRPARTAVTVPAVAEAVLTRFARPRYVLMPAVTAVVIFHGVRAVHVTTLTVAVPATIPIAKIDVTVSAEVGAMTRSVRAVAVVVVDPVVAAA